MKDTTLAKIDNLIERYPALSVCRQSITEAVEALCNTYKNGGKVIVCGNGGSAADSEHIVGELMKKFRRRRTVPAAVAAKLPPDLVARLEGGLPAVSLVSMTSLLTAFANDVAWETAFAQQVLALARPGDVLMTLSTSGNSANCVHAAEAMRAVGGVVVAFTGARPSALSRVADATIAVPETETYRVQELHLPVYHALCAGVEQALFA